MWILENDGEALNGKKVWLRPGKKFVFGRTAPKPDEVVDVEQLFVVSDKTISRKHLTIEIAAVQPGDCANPRTRSRLTLTDLETKIGTVVNDEQIKGSSKVLDKDKNEVQLGRYKHLFRFTWVPFVFTFSFTSKEKRTKPYESLYARLGPLDIKVLDEYQHGVTTHVLARKRNTPKGLQALIDGKHICYIDTFVNAVVAAAHPVADGGAPLEEDFDSNWPDEKDFLPPKGEEPTSRRDDAYAPNPMRQDMFSGYTFVFYEQKQFGNLHAPISGGGGKALFREVKPTDSAIDDFVRYVKGVAGEKGLGEFEDGSTGKGVVVVRWNPVGGEGADWFAEFGREVALKLDQRLIEQNEFLDAILGNAASVLRRPLDFISTGITVTPPISATLVNSQPAPSSQAIPVSTPANEEIAPPDTSRRARARRTARPTRNLLDDDFSGPSVIHSIPESMEVDPEPVPNPLEEPESQGLFVSQDPDTQMQRETSHPPATQTRASRKRAATPLSEDEDVMETMAPTNAAIKRRRLAEDLDRRRRGESTPPPPPIPVIKKEVTKMAAPAKPAPKRSRKAKEETIDPIEEARIRREEAEAAERAERAALEAQLDGLGIDDIRKKLVIEEIEVVRSKPPPRIVAHADESERWEDKWNGRKNFKRFRRRGADESQRRVERVIVALEEVKHRDYGIGDDYWGEERDNTQKKKTKGKARDRDTQDSAPAPAPTSQRRTTEPSSPPSDSDLDDDDDRLVISQRSQQKPSTRASSSDEDPAVTTLTLADKPRNASVRKRAAEEKPKEPPAKRTRLGAVRPVGKVESEEESDDGLMFRLKKRK